MNTDTVKLGDFIELSAPGGPVKLRQGRMELKSQGPSLVDVTITFMGDHALWARIQEEGLFGYSEEVAGRIFGGGFQADEELRFELRPIADAITLLSLMDDDPMGRGLALFDAPADSMLRQQATWRLLTVTQQQGPVRIGMSTSYLGLHDAAEAGGES